MLNMACFVFFFFSSRRRHTRYWRDWSSDVCSSDLREQHPADALEKATLGAGRGEGWGRGQPGVQVGELGQQARGLGQKVARDLLEAPGQAIPPDGGGEPLDEGPVGEVRLARVAARCDGHRTPALRVGQELLGQPSLADTGLSLEHHDVARRPGCFVGPEQRTPLRLATDEGFALVADRGNAYRHRLSLLRLRCGGAFLSEDRWRRQAVLLDGFVDLGRLL